MNNLLNTEVRTYKQFIWQPPIDVYRDAQGWLIKIELAGVRSTDIDISIVGESLVISGKRRDFSIQHSQKIYSMEIAYSRFQRVVNIPSNMDNVKIMTDYQDGMLFIRLKMEDKK